MVNKFSVIIFLFAISIAAYSASNRPELDVLHVPDSLKKNAYCVIRSDETKFEYKSQVLGIGNQSKTITVLDQKGIDLSIFQFYGNKFNKLKKFTGILYDAHGKFLQKYAMSDVETSEYTDNYTLASDAKIYYFNCKPPTIPFTIVYEYECEYKDGLFYFPFFYPQYDYNISVESATYELTLPKDIEYLSKSNNLNNSVSKIQEKSTTKYNWNVQHLKAVSHEKLAPELSSLVPKLYTIPKKFTYDNVEGDISCVEAIGKWQNKLNEKKNILSDEFKAKIIELTKEAKSDAERVKILYDYLGNTTRYVSIQLGIGGYQPVAASEVNKTGFGDCKGLTNYLKSMLEVINIPSDYCIIRLDENKKDLSNDFSSFFETNHIILRVPLPKDTLWLECTNPRNPFGFIHNGISGHDVIVVNQEGGKMLKLPDYPDSLNVEKNDISISLNEAGSAVVDAKKIFKVKIYDQYDWLQRAKANEQMDFVREKIKLPNIVMQKVEISEDKSPLPSTNIVYSFKTQLYGTKSGNRLFVPVNPYKEPANLVKNSNRTQDIKINTGFNDIDSICINIPVGYKIESIPQMKKIECNFGTFTSTFNITTSQIIINQSLLIHSGNYPVDNYKKFTDFLDKIDSAYKGIIIFRKELN